MTLCAYAGSTTALSVYQINEATQVVLATITLPNLCHAMASGTTEVYAATDSGISPINASNVVGSPITVAGTGCKLLLIAPDGVHGYCYPTSLGNSIYPFNVSTNTVGSAIPGIITGPTFAVEGFAFSPDSSTGYISVSGPSGYLLPINVATNTLGTPVTLQASSPPSVDPTDTYVSVTAVLEGIDYIVTLPSTVNTHSDPGGTNAFVTNTSTIAYVSETAVSGTVLPITLSTHTAGTPIVVGQHPVDSILNPALSQLWVCNTQSASISVIATATNTVTSTITLATGPAHICMADLNPSTEQIVMIV